jgi:glutamine synthetase
MSQALDEDVKKRYLDLIEMVADRSPLELGTRVKKGEVIYHHEVYNQLLWNEF